MSDSLVHDKMRNGKRKRLIKCNGLDVMKCKVLMIFKSKLLAVTSASYATRVKEVYLSPHYKKFVRYFRLQFPRRRSPQITAPDEVNVR